MKMCTTDSLDDSLIEKKQEQVRQLKERIEALDAQLTILGNQNRQQTEALQQLEKENQELKSRLVIYEHDTFKIMTEVDHISILYWNSNENQYEVFATFFDNDFESNMEEFCEEFIILLKQMYMVE